MKLLALVRNNIPLDRKNLECIHVSKNDFIFRANMFVWTSYVNFTGSSKFSYVQLINNTPQLPKGKKYPSHLVYFNKFNTL